MLVPIHRAGAVVACAVVDEQDAALLGYRWRLDKDGYARRSVRDGARVFDVRMHRQIMGLERGDPLQVDHINGDPLDNRRENLRVVTHAENRQNVKAGFAGAKSRYRGVSRAGDRWRARVRGVHLGLFDAEEEAGRAAAAYIRETMPFAVER
jgi:hypothetical protein